MKTNIFKSRYMVLMFTILLGCFNPGFSQTTKTTKADGLWSNPDVWTGGAIPDASNKATINNHLVIDMDVNILSLTINAASSLTFDTTESINFTVADEIIVNGIFKVDTNKVNPLKHIVQVGSDFMGPGSIDFYETNGDMVELVFIGNSDSKFRDLNILTGTDTLGNFGGLRISKNIKTATVFLEKSLTINSGISENLQGNLLILKGNLDLDSSSVYAGDNINNLQVDSLGKLFIGSIDSLSCSGFNTYSFHKNSTVEFYLADDYEMTKGWTGENDGFGNLIISGNGKKFFGEGSTERLVKTDLTINSGANFCIDDDYLEVNGKTNIDGILSSNELIGQIIFNDTVSINDGASWMAASNDRFVFNRGLIASGSNEFNSGTGTYVFSENNQEVNVHDTIQNMIIEDIHLFNKDTLTCNTLTGTGNLINEYVLDFTGESIMCNLILDSAGNKVIYSNDNPFITPVSYDMIDIMSAGTSTLDGDVTVRGQFVKDNDGLISLGDYNLIIDTTTNFQFKDPSANKMIVTDGNGSFIIKSKTSNKFNRVYPVGSAKNDTIYSPFEITNLIDHPGGIKYIAVKAVYGHHPGMEDTLGLLKYWSLETDMTENDSINADIKFVYDDKEVVGNEDNYKVKFWTGTEPWVEPDNWNIDAVLNEITLTGVNVLSYDWTAGDSTAMTSKVDDLIFSFDPGVYYNTLELEISTTTPDVDIYYTLNGTMPDISSTLYTGALTIGSPMEVWAIGIKSDWQDSDVKKGSYTFKVDTVKFSIPEGTYNTEQSVELSTLTSGASIYYTLDGSVPDENDILYTGAILIDTSMVIKAIGIKENFGNSEISSASYIIEELVDVNYIITNDFMVYPNPVNDNLFINFNDPEVKETVVNILDINSRVVLTEQNDAVNNCLRISLSRLTPGIYYIRIVSDNTVVIKQIIKH